MVNLAVNLLLTIIIKPVHNARHDHAHTDTMSANILTTSSATSLLQKFAIRFLALLGWSVVFAPLPGPRGVIIVYPHTSNWDFMYALFAKWAIGLPFHWLGKASLFRFGLGPLMRAFGGEPVERGSSTGAISRLATRIRAADEYWLALSPEGTRKYRPTLRSGFYHLALEANIPIGLVQLDYAKKQVIFTDYLDLTGNLATDTDRIRAVFAGCTAAKPGNAAPIIFGIADNDAKAS